MRYDDASQASSANAEPIARADTEVLPQGSFGPATGNAISGAGTTSGANGADSVGVGPGTIAAVQGSGGATGQAAGSFHALGQYGVLSMDAEGNFSYVRNPGTPDGVQDVFQYTLADAAGAQSSTTLTIDIAQVAAAQAGQGIVNLPAGVEMSDIHVNGRDLVIDMPDGTQMVIPGGAVFVPQLAIGDVEVPASNLAALLINSEPQPAAGTPQSSGGNFAVDVPPLDPGVPLGDLIPPTELHYTPPEFEELANAIDHKPTVIIITPDNPAGAVNAVANVDESGLPARGSEPPGTLESQDIETTSGTIVFVAEDGLDSITVGGAEVTAVNQVINGAHGTLTITSIDLASGQIGFSYTATDNTTDGVNDFEDFEVIVTDSDGDTATGNLHINIADDEPSALDDTDTLDVETLTATGNVMSGADTTSGASGKDTVGADDASLTAVSGADGSDSSFNSDGNLVVHGAYGTLTIDANGQYTYVLDDNAPDNVKDVFTYTLTDGDGDIDTATLTITIPNINEPPVVEGSAVNVSEEGLPGGNPDTSGTPDTTNSKTAGGDIGLVDPDGDATTVTLGVPAGSYTSGGEAVHWAVSADGHSLVGYTGSDSTSNHVIEISINNAGEYTVTLVQPFDDPNVSIEDSIAFTVPVSVNDGTETVSTSILVTVEDDAPNAINDTDSVGSDGSAAGNVVTGVGTTNGGADSYGADGAGSVTGIHAGTSGSFTAVPQDGGDVLVHGTFGDLVIHDDGSYTYTRSPNSVAGGTDVFTYQLTDGDGDTDTATLTITVPNINTTPSIGDVDDAVVDEDGLQNANLDANPLQVDPDETNSTEDASFEGEIHVDFKTDVPANLSNAITLVDTAALDGQLQTLDGKDIVFALEGGVLVGRPDGGGDPLITISITGVTAGSGGNATYTYEVDLLGPVQHAGGTELTSSEDSVSLDGVTFTITDSNGDHATGTFDVTIVDDVPTAGLSGQGVPSITLDESATGTDSADGTLPNGIASDTVDFSDAFAAPIFGADGEGSVGYEVHVTGSNVGSGLYALEAGDTTTEDSDGYGQGDEIMLVDNGDGTVSGMIGSTEYFTISVDADGKVTFTQLENIWHPDPTADDESVSIVPDGGTLSLVQTITDGDGDTDSAAVDLSGAFSIQDDAPQPFDGCPDEVNAVNGNGPESDPISLNLPDPGTDLPFVLSFGDIEDGDPVMDNGGHQLSSGGQLLYYSVNESDPTILEARTDPDPGEGTLVFQIDLDPVAGNYTYHQFEAIEAQTEISITDLSSIGGGNVDAKAIDVPDSPYDLILSTADGSTINTSANWIGVSGGQSLVAGDVVRVDFVQDAFVTGSGGGATLNFGEYYSANAFREDVGGLNATQFASFTVRAVTVNEALGSNLSDPADGDNTFYGDTNDTIVADTQLNIYDASGNPVDIAAYNAANPGGDPDIVVTDNGDGSWTVTGLPQGFDFEITSTTPFQAVEIEAVSGTDTFKLGFIDMTSVVEGSVDFTVPITMTDADGDPVSCDIEVNLGPAASGADVVLQVNEAGLDSVGSDPSSDSETNGGDLSSVVSGGTGPYTFELTGSNSDGDSPYGHLTLNPDGTYSFTLENPVDGSTADNGTNLVGGVVTYTYQATDSLGATTTGTITIDVRDDVPTARDDTDTITEGEASQSGNVITGDGTTNVGDSGDDTKGADGATVTAASGFGGAGTVDGDGNVTVTGQWGTLVIHPDGSYTYTLSSEGAAALEEKGEGQTLANEVFTYTLTDGDGDTDTATLTITPTGTNDNPGLIVPDSGDDTKTVYEAGLDERSGEPAGTAEAADGDGTNNDLHTETVTGSFTFSDGDGASTVTINGTTIDLDGPFPLAPIAGTYGNLTITNVVGHTISYSYTLSDNIDHSDITPDQDDFAIVVDDSDGSSADQASDTLTIHIADDAPIAANDTDVINEGDTSETGNVITGVGTTSGGTGEDRVGADDADVTAVSHPTGGNGTVDGDGNITVAGLWGTLVIEPDGDYTYTLSPAGTAALNALGANQTLTPEVFTYTLTDSDGSTDTATLTITPMGDNDSPGLTVPDTGDDTKTVYEAGLAERGGEPAGTAEAADGDGTDNDVTTETKTGTFTFSDGDGASTITIQGNGSAIAIPLAGPFPIAVTGDYGTLTITGISGHTVSYSYTLSDNISHNDANPDQDDFTITVDDSDGSAADAVSDVLTIHIADDAPIADDDTDALVEGETSQTGNVITGAGTTSGAAGDDRVGADDASVTAATGFGGAGTVDGDGNITVTGHWGTIVIEPDGDYTYTLSQAGIDALAAKGEGQTLAPETVTYTLTDSDGSTDTATLTISLTGTNDSPGVNVPDTGADTKTVYEAGLAIRGSEPAGSAEAADGNGTDNDVNSETTTGTFTFTDGDGATTITIEGSGSPVAIPLAGPFPIAVTGDYGTLTITGISGHTVSYSYTLSDNISHSDANPDQDDFTIVVDDSDGSNADAASDVLTIHISDDGPVAAADSNSVTEGALLSVNSASGVLANDLPGADGYVAGGGVVGVRLAGGDTTTAVQTGVNTNIVGSYGTLVLQANGSYTYQANSNVSGTQTDHFVYTIKDSDGSLSTTTLDITVNDGAGPGAGGNVALTLNEFALDMTKDANDLAAGTSTGTNPGATSESQVVLQASGLHFSAGSDDITSIAFSLANPPTVNGLESGFSISWAINGSGQMVGTLMQGATNFGTAIIVQLTGETGAVAGDTADVGVTATLVGRLEHVNPPGTQGPVTITGIEVVASQADGDSNTGTVSITVTDDTPTAPDPEDATVANDASGYDTGTLDIGDSTLTNNVGADGGIARFSHTGLPSLSSGGVTLVYEFSNNDQTLTAKAGAGGAVVFTATISGSSYTIDMNGSLDSLQHVDLNPTVAGFVGGNDPWAGFNLSGPGDILLTPTSDTGTLASDGNTLNTSNILLGVGTGQALDQHEGVRMDFVTNLGGTPAKQSGFNNGYSDTQNRDHTFDGEYTTNGASVILQSESPTGGATVTAAFKAYDDTDGDTVVYHDGVQEVITGITINYRGVIYEDPITHSQVIIPTSTATPYVISGHTFTVQLAADGKTVLVTGIEGESGNSDIGTEIAVYTANGYTSLEVINASTDSTASFKIAGIGASVITNDPVEFDLPVQIVDNDNDVSATGNIHVTAGSSSSSLLSSQSLTTQGFKTALAPSNDNGSNTNAALLGAVAAAGLAASQDVAAHSIADHGARHAEHVAARAEQHELRVEAASHNERGGRGGDHLDVRSGGHHDDVLGKTAIHHDEVQFQHATEHQQKAPAELLQATSAPAHGNEAGPATVTAAAIAMPSAEQLAAVSGAAAPQGQHDQVVGKVLADALQGGQSHGPDLEALINSLPGHGHGPSLAALASHGGDHVPHGHTAFAGVFSTGHNMLTTDHMAAHHDAPPPHA